MIRVAATAAAALALGAPVAFTQPTSIEVLSNGKILVVENNPGRLLRVDPRNGRVTIVVKSMNKPYAIVRAPSGAFYYSQGKTIRKLGGGVVVRNADYIGPLAVGPGDTIYYGTAKGPIFKVGAGRIAANTPIVSPHGLAFAKDGALLVSDTGGNRVVRVGPDGRGETFGTVISPRGLDVGPDGTVYVVDAITRRIARLAPDGKSLGFLGPVVPGDPYDVQVGPNGSVYVLEAGQVGHLRVIDAHGRLTTLRRR